MATVKRSLVPGDFTRVLDVMSRPPVSVDAAIRSEDAERLAQERRVSHLMVLDQGGLVGVLCVCDLWRAPTAVPVGQLMSAPPKTIAPTALAEEACVRMRALRIGCLPVVERGELVGVVTRSDVAGSGGGPSAIRCAACGDHRHVREDPRTHEPFCFECRRRSVPPEPNDDLGGGG